MGLKAEKVEAYLDGCDGFGWPRHYVGFFRCFNQQRYYEAHDVLEELWQDNGQEHPNFAFYKGLIQATGAFVHLKLQREHPDHRIHGARMPPSGRLFRLAFENLARYPDHHDGLDVKGFVALLHRWYDRLHASDYTENPWSPQDAPQAAYPYPGPGATRTEPPEGGRFCDPPPAPAS